MTFNLFVSVKDSSLLYSVTMYLVILIVSCLMILVTEGRGVQGANSRKCAVVNIPLQKDFDAVKFQGKWYGGLKTTSEDSLLSYFMEIYDTRIIFTLNKEKTYDLKAYGSKFYGGWCPKGKGHAVFPSPSEPEKMTFFFDTTIGRKIGMKPGWLLKTDYINYAIFFSCWEVTDSGICDPLNTYVVVIQRKTTKLSDKHMAEVNEALRLACVDPKRLKPVEHYGYCSHDTEL